MKDSGVDVEYLIRNFTEYYKAAASMITDPRNIAQREFGFTFHDRDGMQRHMSFGSLGDLQYFLAYSTPSNAYHSAAYYSDPYNQDMAMKAWLGGDLTFDIDADHIPTNCKPDHDVWYCLDCSTTGKGLRPDACPKCQSKRLGDESWTCDTCLGVAKYEAVKLVDEFLIGEMSLPRSDIEVRFSGNRGFHIHVTNPRVRELDQSARREIGDYVRGMGLDLDGAGIRIERGNLVGPDLSENGWQGRIARGIYASLQKGWSDESKHGVQLTERVKGFLESSREQLLKGLEEHRSNWTPFRGAHGHRGLGKRGLQDLVSQIALHEGCKIDQLVTQDLHRLVRLPSSLHGKTGLIVRKCNLSGLDKFNPFPGAVAFSDEEIRVRVKRIPRIKMGEVDIGPHRDEVVRLPKYLAIYLMCKRQASLHMA